MPFDGFASAVQSSSGQVISAQPSLALSVVLGFLLLDPRTCAWQATPIATGVLIAGTQVEVTVHVNGDIWYRPVTASEMKKSSQPTAALKLQEAFQKEAQRQPAFFATVPSSPIPQSHALALFNEKLLKECGVATKRDKDAGGDNAVDVTTDHFDGNDFKPFCVATIPAEWAVPGAPNPRPFLHGGVAATQPFKVPGPDHVKGGHFVGMVCLADNNPLCAVQTVETPEGHVSIGTLHWLRHYVTLITKPDGAKPKTTVCQGHFGPISSMQKGVLVKFFVPYVEVLEGGEMRPRLIRKGELDAVVQAGTEIKQMAYFSWRKGSALQKQAGTNQALVTFALKAGEIVQTVAPDYYDDMWYGSQPVTHFVPEEFTEEERALLLEELALGLRGEGIDEQNQLTVHLRLTDGEKESCFTNGTDNFACFEKEQVGRGSAINQNYHRLMVLAELFRVQPRGMIWSTRMKLEYLAQRVIRLDDNFIPLLMGEKLVEKSIFAGYDDLLSQVEQAWRDELAPHRQKRLQRKADVLALRVPMDEKEVAIAFNFWPPSGHTLPQRSVWASEQTRLVKAAKAAINKKVTESVFRKHFKGTLDLDDEVNCAPCPTAHTRLAIPRAQPPQLFCLGRPNTTTTTTMATTAAAPGRAALRAEAWAVAGVTAMTMATTTKSIATQVAPCAAHARLHLQDGVLPKEAPRAAAADDRVRRRLQVSAPRRVTEPSATARLRRSEGRFRSFPPPSSRSGCTRVPTCSRTARSSASPGTSRAPLTLACPRHWTRAACPTSTRTSTR